MGDARVLGRAIKDKTIVLTGAMCHNPLWQLGCLFNLGSALGLVQTASARCVRGS